MNDILQHPESDADGMATYEYIVNNSDTCIEHMPALLDNLRRADKTGQFLASTARFLTAVNAVAFSHWIPLLVESAIEKDRERRYIGSLLEAIWGADYKERVDELRAGDDNFRRIYKRIFPYSVI